MKVTKVHHSGRRESFEFFDTVEYDNWLIDNLANSDNWGWIPGEEDEDGDCWATKTSPSGEEEVEDCTDNFLLHAEDCMYHDLADVEFEGFDR